MQAFVGADERTQGKLNGIIVDHLVDFTSVEAPAPDGSDAACNLFDLLRTLLHDKTSACTKDGPKPHAVVGVVLGAVGELSNSCYSHFTAIARVDAARVVSFWKNPPKHALALCKQKILRFWGLAACSLQFAKASAAMLS